MSAGQSTHQQLTSQLYRDHRDWLLGWLRKSLSCPQRAEDLSQDTFVRVLGKADLQQLREPRALLGTIARGLLIDHFRRSALERAYLDELSRTPQAVHGGPEEQALVLEALREIDRLLGNLSLKARSAFLYNRIDGLGHAEIAGLLGVSVPRVRQYLAQALRQCYIAAYGEPAA
ncbi:RNA polymerase sigma factor [Phytopseudomonas dryadis]|uniref:RNA polymerase sigma factor n=1 Tax=Phytopseudomonas dryadis TaxID=2487520 RepID=A0A4Q9R1P0_9GAMM|nr:MULTISPECIES: RNA polymerase sigma factor [Pseudomonas]TBU92898.1 RNA polymerase sigma factor [Pseudomonas dryadis]TBV04641.1 RNA polymerase sigma factor [Pseudomonas dryadis]TBV17271.1 RNA polymerase sigma factor [Pseudomonas sp. FRB 230]